MTGPCRSLPWIAVLVTGLSLAFAAAPTSVAGRITEVDVSERTLTVSDAAAGSVTLEVDGSTVIVLDGDENAVLEDLFAGDEVLSATVHELASGTLYLARAVVTSRVPADGDDPDEDATPGAP